MLFRDRGPAHFTQASACEHGRIETRRIWCSSALNKHLDFPHVGQVFLIERRRTDKNTGGSSAKIAYGITRPTPEQASPEQVLQINRGHWCIENPCHDTPDWNYDEDRGRIRTGFGPENISRLRRFAIGVIKSSTQDGVAQTIRRLCRSPRLVFDYLRMTLNLYGFLSQIIPYQDSYLERLYVFVRQLAAKLPRRKSGPAYQFDDDVRLEYYRLQKISEGSIGLSKEYARSLDGSTKVGSGLVAREAVPLSRLLDLVNERFGTDFNQADQLFFDQMVEAAVLDEGLKQAVAVNPGDNFELVFKNLLNALFVERIDQNEDIYVRFMNDVPFQKTVTGWMAAEAYRRLRGKSP